MEFALFVYVAGIVGNLTSLFGVSATLTLMLFALMTAFTGMNRDIYNTNKPYPYKTLIGKVMLGYVMVAYILVAIIPSQKTMYLMAGAYGSQAIVQSETAGKVVKIVNSKLDEYLEEAEKNLKK